MKDALLRPPDDLELSIPTASNEEPAGDPSDSTTKIHQDALINLIAERTTDLVAITTFSIPPKYIYLSPSHKKILGYDPADLLNRSALDFIHPDDLKMLLPLLCLGEIRCHI